MMETTPGQIDLWRQAPSEHQGLEFKEAKNQFDHDKLYAYCVGMANEGGGVLVLGVANKPPRPVVGTRAFDNPVATAEKIFQAVGFRVDVEEVAHPDGRVLVFHIPQRPRGTAYQYDGKFWMRSGSSLIAMSSDRLRRIHAEGTPEWLQEPAKRGVDAAEIVDLLDTQTFFELLRLPYPSDRTGVIGRLVQERLLEADGGGYAIPRVSALLLAKHLDAFSDLARRAPRVIVYEGTSKLKTRRDQPGSRGYAVGFAGLVAFVMEQLPQNEEIRGALRRQVKLVPETVIRELVANALIHQDFSIDGVSMMVEIYSDRVEISSPGDPVVPVDRFIDGYESRNERLALIMRRLGICEEKGSGIDRVIDAVEEYQLPPPEFRNYHRRTTVAIHGPKKFGDMDAGERIRACYQHCCLRYVMNEKMSNQTLRKRFRLPESRADTASRIIRDAIEQGRIKLDADAGTSKRHARYIPFWA